MRITYRKIVGGKLVSLTPWYVLLRNETVMRQVTSRTPLQLQSGDIEETIERIQNHKGVVGVIILGHEGVCLNKNYTRSIVSHGRMRKCTTITT